MRRIVHHIFFSITTFGIVTATSGQARIKGRIKDKEQNIALASVQLLGPDSVLIQSTLSDNDGYFVFNNVDPGIYFIAGSAAGYTNSLFSQVKIDTVELFFTRHVS